MASPSVTYTFANGSDADATQVNQNFTDLISGLTDGTKDLNINNLALAGSLSVTGTFASSLIPATNALYNLGSSSLGWATVYVGDSTKTIGISAAGVSATYTLTLPPTLPSQITNTTISATGVMGLGRPSAPGHAVTSSSGSFSTASAVAVTVTNLSVSYTRLRTGSPIFVELIASTAGGALVGVGSSTTANSVPEAGVYLNKSGTGVIASTTIVTIAATTGKAYGFPPSTIKFVDTSGTAGDTNTFSITCNAAAGPGPVVYFTDCKMIVYEL